MDDDEYEAGVAHDDVEDFIQSIVSGRKNNKWFLIAGLSKLAADICGSFQEFFEVNYIGATQRYAWQQRAQDTFENASADLEKLSAEDFEEMTRTMIANMGWEVDEDEEE